MDKETMKKEIEDIRIRVIRMEAELLPTEKATSEDIKSHKEALKEFREGKAIWV